MLFEDAGIDETHPAARDLMTAGILQDLRTPGSMYGQNDNLALDTLDNIQLASAFLGNPDAGGFDQYGGIGNWLFNDWDGKMMW